MANQPILTRVVKTYKYNLITKLMCRKKILFIINNEVVVEELQDLTVEQVERMKQIVAEECQCSIREISVEYEDLNVEKQELSDIDATGHGFVDWKDPNFKELNIGLKCTLKEDSIEFFDAVFDGTILDYIKFV